MTPRRSSRALALASVLSALGALALLAAPALAAPTRGYLAYQTSNGDVPAAFAESGAYGTAVESAWGGKVKATGYAIAAYEINGEPHNFDFTPSGGEFDYIDGNLITGTPAGEFPQFSGTMRIITTGPDGTIYFVSIFTKAVYEFKPSGEFIREFETPDYPGDIAIDPTNGNLLIAQLGGITEFDPFGVVLGRFDVEGEGGAFGFPHTYEYQLTVSASGFVYAGQLANQYNGEQNTIDIFLPVGVAIPEATTDAPSGISRTAATLHATVEPAGGAAITHCHFSYVADSDYRPQDDDPFSAEEPYNSGLSAATAPCLNSAGEEVGTEANPITATTESESIHAPVTLRAGTAYHYRISVSNEAHPSIFRHGFDQAFATPPRSLTS